MKILSCLKMKSNLVHMNQSGQNAESSSPSPLFGSKQTQFEVPRNTFEVSSKSIRPNQGQMRYKDKVKISDKKKKDERQF